MAIQRESDQRLFEQYNGHTVRLQVSREGFSITEIDDDDQISCNVEPKVISPPRADPTVGTKLLTLEEILRFPDPVTVAGAKAAQFAKVATVEGAAGVLSSSFAVPFAVYLDLVHSLDLASRYASITSTSFVVDGASAGVLAAIENEIVQSHHLLQEKVVADIVERIKSSGWHATIFRSSTNVEDLPGFNGAGLYESIVVHDVSTKTVAEALLSVFASAWTFRGWSERVVFGIEPDAVAMAVLVQPFLGIDKGSFRGEKPGFPSVLANGVALTASPPYLSHRVGNPSWNRRMSFYVNALSGTAQRVTESRGDCSPEEVLVHLPTWGRPLDVQLLAVSSCQHTKVDVGERKHGVLTTDDAAKMVDVFSRLHEEVLGFHVGAGDSQTALDVEFLIVQPLEGDERDLMVLQARPINV